MVTAGGIPFSIFTYVLFPYQPPALERPDVTAIMHDLASLPSLALGILSTLFRSLAGGPWTETPGWLCPDSKLD